MTERQAAADQADEKCVCGPLAVTHVWHCPVAVAKARAEVPTSTNPSTVERRIKSDADQVYELERFIVAEIPGEPAGPEWVSDIVIRVIRRQAKNLADLDKAIERLEDQIADLESDLEDEESALTEARETAKEYRRDLRKANRALNKERDRADRLQAALNASEAEVERLKRDLERLSTTIAHTERVNQGLITDKRNLQATLEEMGPKRGPVKTGVVCGRCSTITQISGEHDAHVCQGCQVVFKVERRPLGGYDIVTENVRTVRVYEP
jgi:prefoldin subunit 5